MYFSIFCIFLSIIRNMSSAQEFYESDINFRVEPGARTCFFETGKVGQILEAQYHVIDGQHGDLDISFDILDPNGTKLVADYKMSQNSIIMDLTVDGDYVICLDNTHSMVNSKLVFVYVLIEDKKQDTTEAEVGVVDNDGKEHVEEEILEWRGTYDNGEYYFIEIAQIAESMTRTLKHVVKARKVLEILGAMKNRDSYLAFEDTFIVDMWSGFQITFMCLVGVLQVYMIKKLFNRPASAKGKFKTCL